jgi:hypothetical protein
MPIQIWRSSDCDWERPLTLNSTKTRKQVYFNDEIHGKVNLAVSYETTILNNQELLKQVDLRWTSSEVRN